MDGGSHVEIQSPEERLLSQGGGGQMGPNAVRKGGDRSVRDEGVGSSGEVCILDSRFWSVRDGFVLNSMGRPQHAGQASMGIPSDWHDHEGSDADGSGSSGSDDADRPKVGESPLVATGNGSGAGTVGIGETTGSPQGVSSGISYGKPFPADPSSRVEVLMEELWDNFGIAEKTAQFLVGSGSMARTKSCSSRHIFASVSTTRSIHGTIRLEPLFDLRSGTMEKGLLHRTLVTLSPR